MNKQAGKPYLIFISKVTKSRRFAKPTKIKHPATHFLEDLLIGMALANNPRLENIRGAKFFKEMVVPGIMNTPKGKATKASVQFLKGALHTK